MKNKELLRRVEALIEEIEKFNKPKELEVEEYRDVIGYEGLYEVSNLGNVKSLERKVKHSSGNGFTTIKEKILSKSISPQGYYKVRLSKEGIKKTHLIHHLVAESFLNHIERNNNISIDHIDENKLNNSIENLQIVSKKYNTKRSYDSSIDNRILNQQTWYKYNKSLFFYSLDYCYGFKNNEWSDNFKWDRFFGVIEATPKEVEESLIKEAIKRGYKYDIYSFNDAQNVLYGYRNGDVGHEIVFDNGDWSEVDKFAELKEAHKNGAVIQFRNESTFGNWLDLGRFILWNPNNEYRIKPDDKPKVGDVVKAWDDVEQTAYIIGVVRKIEKGKFLISNEFWLPNVKKLSQQEVIELLFGN